MSIHLIKTLDLDSLCELARQGQDIVPFSLAGEESNCHLILDPGIVRQVLADSQHYSKEGEPIYQFIRQCFGNSLTSSSGEFHHRQRQIIQPSFHRRHLASFETATRYALDGLLSQWSKLAPGPIPLLTPMQTVALHTVEAMVSSGDLAEQTYLITTYLNVLVRTLVSEEGSHAEMEEARALCYQAIKQLLQKRRQCPGSEQDLLALLLQALDETGEALPDKQIADEMLTMIVAGYGGISFTLVWLWYELSQNREVERQLHEELDQVLGSRFPTLDDLPQLPYTRWVFAETLRLYPPDTILPRRVKGGDQRLGQTILPEGSLVYVVPYLLHRDSRWWDDPERFLPERWQALSSPARAAYWPWGGGQHTCIGQPLAELEAPLIIAAIAQQFRLHLMPGALKITPQLMGINILPNVEIAMLLDPRSATGFPQN